MRNHLTYIDFIIQIKLDIRHPNSDHKIWLLVEGDSDIKVLKKFCTSSVSIENVPGGVGKLIEAINILCFENNRILGIRDLDFSFIKDNYTINTSYLFKTDLHDFEMLMLKDDEIMKAITSEYITALTNNSNEIKDKI